MNLILFDDPALRTDLHPFTLTRPCANLRVGILTIDEKWHRRLGLTPSYLTASYLQPKFTLTETQDNLLINGAVCPDEKLIAAVHTLESGDVLVQHGLVIAARQPVASLATHASGNVREYPHTFTLIDKPWKIFGHNAAEIKQDFALITKGRTSQGIQDKHTVVYGEENVFVEEGVDIKAAIINAETGPVYLGRDSTIQEGAMIRGSFALCEGGHLNMGAKIRGDTTVGPYCKAGGEIGLSVLYAYSNKAHDGYLGCSVLGEWCNLGADTNTSNLKNNFSTVKVWSHAQKKSVDTGLQFCGLIMGDHSKSSINTMFNTGTVVDFSCNIFGGGFPPTYIPSFSWGGSEKLTTFKPEKAIEVAERMMARRHINLTDAERQILWHLYAMTAADRAWEPASKLYNA